MVFTDDREDINSFALNGEFDLRYCATRVTWACSRKHGHGGFLTSLLLLTLSQKNLNYPLMVERESDIQNSGGLLDEEIQYRP